MDSNKKYLGIDWGSAKIGLAIAEGETRMSFGYGKLESDKNLLENLIKIISQEDITDVIIGIPEHFFRNKKDFVGKSLADNLRQRAGVGVFFQNEMFTTKMAEANLIERGVKKIKHFDDQEAARIILQEWLNKLK